MNKQNETVVLVQIYCIKVDLIAKKLQYIFLRIFFPIVNYLKWTFVYDFYPSEVDIYN